MNCPRCGLQLRDTSADGRFVCAACRWEQTATPQRKSLFGDRLLTRREVGIYAVAVLVLLALPFVFFVVILPLLAAQYPRVWGQLSPQSLRWFVRHYWLIVAVYLAASALIHPAPELPSDPDSPEYFRSSEWNTLLVVLGLLLIPGKWFWLVIYSWWCNRRGSG